MKNLTKFFFLMLVPAFLANCSMTVVNVDSSPQGATVRAKPVGQGEFKVIGKTPLVVQGEELDPYFGGSGAMYIEIEKEGYLLESILVTELSTADIKIVKRLKEKQGIQDPVALNAAVSELFEIQRLVRVKSYEEALGRLAEIQKVHPTMAIVYELKGGIQMLKENYPAAFDSYVMAVKLEPSNVEAIRVRDVLSTMLGVPVPRGGNPRLPASVDKGIENAPKPQSLPAQEDSQQ